jgi:DNA-binding MarR family transcriptional regulator
MFNRRYRSVVNGTQDDAIRPDDGTPPDDAIRWLNDEERVTWMTMVAMLMTLPAAIDVQLKRDAGLNFFEYSILVALSRPPGRAVRMNMLALVAGGSASRLSHAVSRLERQGWVRRLVRSGEPRCIEAVLTGEGMAVLAAAAPDHVREARRLVIDVLTPEQLSQFQKISRQVLEVAAPDVGEALDQAIIEAAEEGGCTEFDR